MIWVLKKFAQEQLAPWVNEKTGFGCCLPNDGGDFEWFTQTLSERTFALTIAPQTLPDLQNRFQWEEGFENRFIQPLLQPDTPCTPVDQQFWDSIRKASILSQPRSVYNPRYQH